MKQPNRPTGISSEEWAKRQAEADVANFATMVEDATVEEVETPTGRKQVEIAWEDENGFHTREGEAIGLYRNYEDEVYHIDWTDGSRTTVAQDDVVDLDEGDYHTK